MSDFDSNIEGRKIREDFIMKEKGFTMGNNERKAIIDWFVNQSIRSLRQARLFAAIQSALDEVRYTYTIAEGEKYTSKERLLCLVYHVAIGVVDLHDLINDYINGGDIFNFVFIESGLIISKSVD